MKQFFCQSFDWTIIEFSLFLASVRYQASELEKKPTGKEPVCTFSVEYSDLVDSSSCIFNRVPGPLLTPNINGGQFQPHKVKGIDLRCKRSDA